MTLSFIPKLIVLVLALVLTGSWMLDLIVSFSRELMVGIPELISLR
jgi:flagellar biosynthetic protein FliQ